MLQDLLYSIRALTRAPAFAIAALVTLALGVGANTVTFSIVNALLLRPLPLGEPERLVRIYTGSSHVSYPNYRDFAQQADVFSDIAAHRYDAFNMAQTDIPERVNGEYVTGNYFTLLGIIPIRGRLLSGDDDRLGAPPAVVISEALWRGRLGASPDVIGRTLQLNGHPVTIVGVTPAEFHGTYPMGLVPEVWVPAAIQPILLPGPDRFSDRNNRWLQLTAKLKPGVSRAQASAAVGTIAQNLKQTYPKENPELDGTSLYGLTGVGAYRGIGFAPLVLLFLGFLSLIVYLILLIACANVANLFLARAWSRQREIAIRTALGAGRRRILRLILSESFVIAVAGGTLGCLFAFAGVRLIENFQALLPIPLGVHLSIDSTVVIYTLALSIIAGAIIGLAPAWQGAGANLSAIIGSSGVTASRRRQRLKDMLVVGEVAICFVVLACAGLFARSLQHAGDVDPGFETRQIVTASLNLETSGYDERSGLALLTRITDELRGIPGVRSVSLGRIVPLSLNRMEFRVWSSQPQPVSEMVLVNSVGPDYFSTMSIPVLRGREFTSADTAASSPVVIVSEALAKRFWPGEDPIGKTLQAGGRQAGELGPAMTVAGMVRDSKYYSLGERPQPILYLALAQGFQSDVVVHIATSIPPALLRNPVKQAVLRLDRSLLVDVATMEENLQIAVLPARIAVSLTGMFSLLGLILASAGIYALVAYAVGQRKKEIGIRIALGAGRTAILRMIVLRGLALAGSGVAIGVVLALVVSQLLKSMLIGIVPADPITFAAAAMVLLVIAAAASWLPAKLATRINPANILRSE